jgi:hypothetical protein
MMPGMSKTSMVAAEGALCVTRCCFARQTMTCAAVSIALHSWAQCLSLAGLYSRAEFALKAAATPLLFAKGQLAARSLTSFAYDDLIAKNIFGISFAAQSLAGSKSSRPSTTSRPNTTSRTGTRGNEDAIRRPVSSGSKSEAVLGGPARDIQSPAEMKHEGAACSEDKLAGVVESLMLQDDTADGAESDITFHNIQAATTHPECTSWIDVALVAAGACAPLTAKGCALHARCKSA